jgi:hypothetical protein
MGVAVCGEAVLNSIRFWQENIIYPEVGKKSFKNNSNA